MYIYICTRHPIDIMMESQPGSVRPKFVELGFGLLLSCLWCSADCLSRSSSSILLYHCLALCFTTGSSLDYWCSWQCLLLSSTLSGCGEALYFLCGCGGALQVPVQLVQLVGCGQLFECCPACAHLFAPLEVEFQEQHPSCLWVLHAPIAAHGDALCGKSQAALDSFFVIPSAFVCKQ